MASQDSLWDRAVASLSDEDKQAIDFFRSDKPAILSDVLQAAENKQQLCMQKRWKYSKKNGDVVIIRDVCEKLIKWVNKFKQIGDMAVQYDPAHVSLPWAAVRFFLQLSINDVQIFGAMAEGLEMVSSHITRCHLYEQLYLSQTSIVRPELERALLRLYTALLTYLARARQYYAKSTLGRVGASLLNTSDSVEACLAKVTIERDEVERCTNLIDTGTSQETNGMVSETQASLNTLAGDMRSFSIHVAASQDEKYQSLKTILVSFEQPTLRTSTQIWDIHTSLQKEGRRQILSWLSTVKYREHHKSSFSTVMPGSGSWLQLKREFINWKSSSSSSILWIHGIPGSGKSKLMATVIQQVLESKSTNTATSAFAYFYCSRDAAETQRADPGEIMRALLKQLSCFDATQPIHAAVTLEYDKRQKDADADGLDPLRLSLGDCRDLILDITSQSPVIIMIDALDECDPSRRHELLQALRVIVRDSSNLVKIIISSRDDADIVCRLNNVPNVYISSDDNGDDVERYIDIELDKAIDEQRLLKGCIPIYLRDRILRQLKARANGMFLWASLQIQNLCDPERMLMARDVEDALMRPPPTLFQMYSGIMERIERIAPYGRALAKKSLKWLLCARKPLTEHTLTQMLAFTSRNEPSLEIPTHFPDLPQQFQIPHIPKDVVLSICCNFVVLDTTLNIFRFAHASVRELLEALPDFCFREINLEVAQDCMSLLLSQWEDSSDRDRLTVVPNPPRSGTRDASQSLSRESPGSLAAYVVDFWIFHYCELDYHWRIDQQLAPTIMTFFVQGMSLGHCRYSVWAQMFHGSYGNVNLSVVAGPWKAAKATEYARTVRPLDVACAYGLLEVVVELSKCAHIGLNEPNHAGHTALYIAAANGHYHIVDKLLKLGSDPGISTEESRDTALHCAAGNGFDGTVLLLLQHGADPTVKND
ncbi:MAG: hypothetical protein Q9218_003002 [Villophora microphyllina]